jgi:hypothetical protein
MIHSTRCGIFGRWLGVLLTQLVVAPAWPTELTLGNVLVSVRASSDSTLREYSPSGSLVQSVDVPYPLPPRPSSEVLRDIVVTPTGSVAIYNGTFEPYLTRWAPATGDWLHDTHEGWDTVNAVSYGGIAAWQSCVFATDMGAQAGIVRFDTASGTAARYFADTDFADLTIGFDGLLYALWPNAPVVYAIDPSTMEVQRSFWLGAACQGIAVGSGYIFGASGDGNLYKFTLYGSLLGTLDPNVGSLSDIDVDASGRLVAGAREGWVVMSDASFSSMTSFRATNYKPVFVSFTTPVPEPASIVGALLLATLIRRREAHSAA